MAAVYQIIEGIITTVLAKQYRSSFACKNGITNAFLCSFYRVATLGSGSGVAAIIYLGEQGIEYGGGFGLYMIQYALHKMSIALFSAILFVMNWEFMKSWFGDYAGLLAGGYAVTFVITIGLFLFCCSKKFHRLIFRLLDIIQEASQVDEFPPDHADRQVGDTKPIPDISFEKFPVPAVRYFDKGDA